MGSINWINAIFIFFISTISIMGTLINFVEPYLPVLLTQTFRFGKHSYKGAPSRLVQLVEIPKAWFRHFYVSALFVSTACMYIVVHVYVGGYQTPDSLLWLLDVLCGSDREVSSNPTTTFLAVLLLFVQCLRRFYETHFVQIFSSSSKINITHYLVGHLHYFGAFATVLSQAHGFVRETSGNHHNASMNSLQLRDCGPLNYVAVVAFLYCWLQQFESNLILAQLRCDANGKVVSQKHRVPRGGYFEVVSSPHMMFEVLMYIALFLLVPQNTSWLFVLCWVLVNQIENAWLTHKWYLTTFSDYPAKRRAIFPLFL